jgi:RNA polymerase-binding transcription factor DksA
MEYWEERKMKRLSRIRICKLCGNEIDNSKRKMHKRTKFCSEDCVDDYNEERRLRRLG